MKVFKKIKDIIKSTILCIRFPFLYPRNRFDGAHHANLLSKWSYKLRQKAIQEIGISAKVNKSDDYFTTNAAFFDYHVKLDKISKQIFVRNIEGELIRFDYTKCVWGNDKFEVLGIKLIFSIGGSPIIQIQVKPTDENDNGNYRFAHYTEEFVVNKWYNFWYKVITWFDEKVLDKIFFLPSYTELDAMEPGWRKAFGIQMCKEIKAELKKHKFLYKYRIVQIKEKFSGLRWYDAGVPKDSKIWDIINKYEGISMKTCGQCGKPATKMSTGWIYPYCDDCIGDRDFTEIDKNPFAD